MNRKIKRILSEFAPPVITSLYRKNRAAISFSGDYAKWEDAVNNSSGYDSDMILDKVKHGLLKVKNGEAAFERDSVTFDTIDYSWPVLTALLWIASRNSNNLKIVDFGGSLGSVYFQHRVFLQHLNKFEWIVVEQKNFVECGKELFEDEHLHFCGSFRETMINGVPSTVLLSSVLPYLSEPYKLLRDIIDAGFQFVLIDRTPFIEGEKDRLTVQKVSGKIYKASYPAWFLSEQKLMATFQDKYRVALEFQRSDHINIPSRYRGVLFEKINTI